MRILFLLFVALVCVSPVYAAEGKANCSEDLLQQHFYSVNIIKAMADYKAAMEAGYKGCSAIHKEEFKNTGDLRKFWQEKTDEEMTLAVDIFSYIAATVDAPDDLTEQCVDEASDEVLVFAENQYKKSYDRRYKMLKAEKVDLNYETNDSCRWVVESLEKYKKSYDKQPAMRNILFRIASDYSWLSKGANRKQKNAFKQFEKTRKTLIKQATEKAE